jgi:amidase
MFRRVELLVLPTIPVPPPLLDEVQGFPATVLTAPFNLAGVPALALPLPGPEPIPGRAAARLPVPASLQLVGPAGGEELLCATALAIESALGHRSQA